MGGLARYNPSKPVNVECDRLHVSEYMRRLPTFPFLVAKTARVGFPSSPNSLTVHMSMISNSAFSPKRPRFLDQTMFPLAESSANSFPPRVMATTSFWNPNWSRCSRSDESGTTETAEEYDEEVKRVTKRMRYDGRSYVSVRDTLETYL